jgi:Putative MetA-pathway of phenol degradation
MVASASPGDFNRHACARPFATRKADEWCAGASHESSVERPLIQVSCTTPQGADGSHWTGRPAAAQSTAHVTFLHAAPRRRVLLAPVKTIQHRCDWSARRRVRRAIAVATVALMLATTRAFAQDLEPRAYSASPVGTTFLVFGVGRSNGGVLLDPSVPFEDVKATIGIATVGVGHTFDLFSRTALVVGVLPYGRGHATGRIEETTGEATRVGWADARAKLSVNLFGGRALRAREFAQAPPRGAIIGVSLSVAAPTGQYHSDRLVNLGSNRWSYKPEAGVSVANGRWTFDGYGGVWLFGDNDEFFPGASLREQDPVFALQGHVSYTVRRGFWVAFDGTWYSGGTSSVDGIDKADLQRNSRVGVTASYPLGARQSLKGAFSSGATTRVGGDFNTLSIAWQMVWVRP